MSAIEAPRGEINSGNHDEMSYVFAHSIDRTDMSVSEDSDDQSWHSPFESTAGGSYRESRFSGKIEGMPDDFCGSECSSEINLESGDLEVKVHLGKVDRDCRICHLGLERGSRESGIGIGLGCSCKGDLGFAHRQCAETWFKIKGNTGPITPACPTPFWVCHRRICEICGATAQNIVSEQTNDAENAASATPSEPAPTMIRMETRTIWHGRLIMNFLLACLLLAFVVSWLFHFKLIS